jgi:hypothetical protein
VPVVITPWSRRKPLAGGNFYVKSGDEKSIILMGLSFGMRFKTLPVMTVPDPSARI